LDIDGLSRDKEVAMKRYLTSVAVVAALAGTAVFASSAMANSFAVSIGTPGFAVGYSNYGGYVSAYAPPPVYYAPTPYYGPAYYGSTYYGPPVAFSYYGGYRPYHHYYHRHW